MPGIKETKEVLVVGFAVAKILAEQVKDGVQGKDALALLQTLLTDTAFQAKVQNAIVGIQNVPAEMKDISIFEGLELGQFALGQVKEIGAILA